MRRVFPILFAVSMLVIGAPPALAIDPPHDDAGSSDCSLCHTFHNAPGGALTLYAGNANLCQSCHVLGGPAAALPFVETDQALPGPGLPAGVSPTGTSHRWDSGPGGHVTADGANTSTGTVESGGAFTGRFPKTYTITITTPGDVGVALFDWTATAFGAGSSSTVHDEFGAQSYANNDGTVNWVADWIDPEDSNPTAGDVQITGGGASTALDQFNIEAYNNSNGSYDWSGEPWVETDNQGGGASGGDIEVRINDNNCPGGGSGDDCLRVTADTTGDNIYRPINLAGATTATLTYDYDMTGNNGTVKAQVQGNGNGWTDLATYSSSSSGNESFDLKNVGGQDFAAADTQIRFYVSFGDGGGADDLHVDDVQIAFTAGGAELRLNGPPGGGDRPSAAREVDLSGTLASATFTFDYRTDTGVDAADAVVVEVSNNGGTSYSPLETITGVTGATSGSKSYGILSSAAVDTRIRLRVSSGYDGANEFFFADNVQVAYSTPPAGGGSGTNVTTGVDVPLDEGVTVTFTDGAAFPSFVLNDEWNVYVRTDLNDPTDPELLARLEGNTIMCSTCHDQHSQVETPFDPAAPAYGGPGTGADRHFQRSENFRNEMCKDCHSARDVGSLASQGAANLSHPVYMSTNCITCHWNGTYKPDPDITPVGPDHGSVQCMTCHDLHFNPVSDGALVRGHPVKNPTADVNIICTNCHSVIADIATPAAHFDAVSGLLWPGGEYGSNFPEITDGSKRGKCTNCHQPHGWPDDDDPDVDYRKLLVERNDTEVDSSDPDDAEALCYTCHDATGPAPDDIRTVFTTKAYRHPVVDSEQLAGTGRSVECGDCHNLHKTKSGTHTPQTNTAGPPLDAVAGLEPNYPAGFWAAPLSYSAHSLQAGVDPEAWVCFRCHSSNAAPLPNTPSGGFQQTDTAREFNPNNVGNYGGSWSAGETAGSFHPVLASAGGNLGATSNIKAPWTRTSLMTCSDCHGSDNAADPNGPHGSTASFMLKGPNTAWDDTLGTTSGQMPAGTFCINCHNQDFTNSRFDEHDRDDHGDNPPGGGTLKCWNCHAAIPHGTARPGLLVTPHDGTCDASPSVSGLQVTDAFPYMQLPAGNSGTCFISYPVNNTTTWDQNDCGCGNDGWGH